jgi:hypothetical protein
MVKGAFPVWRTSIFLCGEKGGFLVHQTEEGGGGSST